MTLGGQGKRPRVRETKDGSRSHYINDLTKKPGKIKIQLVGELVSKWEYKIDYTAIY